MPDGISEEYLVGICMPHVDLGAVSLVFAKVDDLCTTEKAIGSLHNGPCVAH